MLSKDFSSDSFSSDSKGSAAHNHFTRSEIAVRREFEVPALIFFGQGAISASNDDREPDVVNGADVARPGFTGSITRLTTWLAGLWTRVRGEFEMARAASILASLDDHMLRDLGIDRYQIDHIVRHGRQWD